MAAPAPDEPVIGGIDNQIPWCGGEPNLAWNNTLRDYPASPYAKRYNDKNEMAVYQLMTGGLATKLKRGDPSYTLTSFAEDVKAHLVKTGMDAVFYMMDPARTNARIDIIYKHSRISITQVRTELNVMTEVIAENDRPALFSNLDNPYDEYDASNATASREFLLNSIDSTLKADMRSKITADMLGPEVWMVIVMELQSGSYRAMEAKKEKLRKIKLSDFPGENVKTMNNEVVTLCSELDQANRLPEDALVTVVSKYGKSTVEEFRIGFIARRNAVEDYVSRNYGRTNAEIIGAGQELITYRTLTEEGEGKYQSLLDSGEWTAAQSGSDKSGAPEVFCMETLSDQGKSIMMECHAATNGDGEIICFLCKEKGHIARFCPKSGNQPPPNNNNNKGGKKKIRWQQIPPKQGEMKQKMVKGKKYLWCAHCGRWTMSHSTDQHEGPKKDNNGDEQNENDEPAPEGQVVEVNGSYDPADFVAAW